MGGVGSKYWQWLPFVEEDIDGGPLGVLPMGPAVATTKVEEDVNGKAPGGCCRRVSQRPPPKMRKTSMTGPLGLLPVGPAAATTKFEEDVDGGPL
jgi:hypothetical protein